MAPSSYPGRGTWLFRNITRGFTYTPRLDSILISQSQPEALANIDFDVEDAAEALVFANEDHCEVLFTKEGGTEQPLWRGHINARTEDSVGGAEMQRLWVVSGQDYTAKLDDAIVRRRKTRKREKARRRIRWLLSYMKPNIWSLDGIDLANVPTSEFAYVEAYDYHGMTVSEALQHVADELRLFYYVDFDNVFHMFRTETEAPPFALDNVAPDYATTYPFRAWTHEEESTELHNATLVTPEKVADSRWSRDAESVLAYGRQESHIADSSLGGPTAATNVGARAIAQDADPQETSHAECWEPGLVAGMTVHVTEGLWGHDFDRIIEAVEIRAVDPHDDDDLAKLHTTLTLTDRRPAKGIGNRNRDKDAGTTPDTGPHPLVDFTEDVTPPALSLGAAVGSFIVTGQAVQERQTDIKPWILYPSQDDTPREIPYRFVAGRSDEVVSGVGSSNSWTSRPTWVTGCPGVSWAMSGWYEAEQWFKLTVPAHPANMAGISVAVQSAAGYGYGTVAGLDVVVAAAEPTAMRQGTVVATLTAGESRTVTIPGSMVPAEGGELWLGYRTAWESSFKSAVYDFRCGLIYVGGPYSYDVTDQGHPWWGYTGRHAWALPVSATWQTWGATAPDMGTTTADPDAPWQGGNTISDAGFEGAGDAWGVADNELYVSDDAPAGKGITVIGNRSDDDENDGPWSDAGWAHEIPFRITALGDPATAGPRGITSTVVGEGESAIGIVHLGDLANASGISVLGPVASSFAAKTLTVGDIWKAKIDTRSGLYVRGKLWRAIDGQPAHWDVQAELTETEDADDRWTLWLRAGNVGTEQGVYVQPMRAFQGANPGQRIVKEYLGRARGIDKTFHTAHPFRTGSLRAMVNGHAVAPVSIDGSECSYTLDFWPTANSIMRATYVVR